MIDYQTANYAVKNIHHDTAKAFLIGMKAKFETSEMPNDECCFSLYDMSETQAHRIHEYLEQECKAVLLPF